MASKAKLMNLDQIEEDYFLGLSTISIDQLVTHESQRMLDPTFVDNLAKNLPTASSRANIPLSIVPEKPLPSSIVQELISTPYGVALPDSLKFYIIDGQHRVKALLKVREKIEKAKKAKEDEETEDTILQLPPEFFSWPCRIYRPEFAKLDHLKAWMVSRNTPGAQNVSAFVDKLGALDVIQDQQTRLNMCSLVSKDVKEEGLLKYLVKSPYWEEIVDISRRSLYRELTWRSMIGVRPKAREADFYRLILRDVIDQHDHILELLRSVGDEDPLTFTAFTNDGKKPVVLENEADSTSATAVPNLLWRLRKLRNPAEKDTAHLPYSALLDILEKRKKPQDGFEVGSPYVFGRMIPLPADLGGNKFSEILIRCRAIANYLSSLFPRDNLPKMKQRAATKGATKEIWDTWLTALETSLKNKSSENDIQDVLAYILRNESVLFIGENDDLILSQEIAYKTIESELAKNNAAREGWNRLIDFCIDKGFPLDREGRELYFPDRMNQAIRTGYPVVQQLEEDPDLMEEDLENEALDEEHPLGRRRRSRADEAEYGIRDRSKGGKGKGKQEKQSKASSSTRVLPPPTRKQPAATSGYTSSSRQKRGAKDAFDDSKENSDSLSDSDVEEGRPRKRKRTTSTHETSRDRSDLELWAPFGLAPYVDPGVVKALTEIGYLICELLNKGGKEEIVMKMSEVLAKEKS